MLGTTLPVLRGVPRAAPVLVARSTRGRTPAHPHALQLPRRCRTRFLQHPLQHCDSAVAERTAAAVNDSISLNPVNGRRGGGFVCLRRSRFSYGCTARVRTYQPRVLPIEEADEVGRADAEHRPAVPIYSTDPPYLFIAPARRTYL
jgi:hypothetical protein